MNRSQTIGGVVCLALAALIAVLAVTLPSDRMVFMIGDTNAPIVPAIALGVIGVLLLGTAWRGQEPEVRTAAKPVDEMTEKDKLKAEEKRAQNGRLEAMGWGLFLIMLGGFALIPDDQIPRGVWSIGVGVIMLGLNAARYYYGIKLSGFTTFLGILALLGGIAQLLGVDALDGALLFIILGAYLILKPWFDKRGIFGKVEEG
jgi:hypothetical protein